MDLEWHQPLETHRVIGDRRESGVPGRQAFKKISRSFRDVASPAQGLGVNLFGAVVGGTLENVVMIGGTMSLGILAIALYGLSAVFAGRSKQLATD